MTFQTASFDGMNQPKMKPTLVFIQWSEAGHPLGEDTVMSFQEFEAIAEQIALDHSLSGGGYLKTKITVHFDNGHTYELRLDLNSEETGFKNAIEDRIQYHESDEGQKRLAEAPKQMRDYQEELYAVWLTMDFTQCSAWNWWEAGSLTHPVDTTFCTLTTRN